MLRAFLEYQIDQWLEMNGHLKGEKDWERFHNAKNRATFAAADRIIALLKTESGKEPPVPSSSGEYYGWNDTDDLRFALRKKISAFGWAYRHDPDWSDNFQEFIVEMKKNPANKYIVKLAEANWFGIPFNAAVFFNDYSFEQRLLRYQYNFEQLKVYCAENADDPCLKFAIDHWRAIHTQAAEVLEGSDQIKKGTLAKPALEFYRVLYQKYPDAPEAEGWLRNINSDLVKYDILSASDPTAAFQEAVTELKKSLENEINGESWLKVGDFIQIAEELESRNQSLVLLLTTVRPLFAASENEKIRDHVLGFDIRTYGLSNWRWRANRSSLRRFSSTAAKLISRITAVRS